MLASAPGRVNLIGEHTDYNDGFVLPMAIDRRVYVAASRRSDDRIVALAEMDASQRQIAAGRAARDSTASAQWHEYVAGVVRALRDGGRDIGGANLVLLGDVPVGAGLASSAALELSIMRAVCACFDVPWEPRTMARLAQRAENEFVGVACGIMDQIAASEARAGCAMLLDCRSLEADHVSLPEDVRVIVMDTGVRRALAASEYNERRVACERAVAAIRATTPHVRALRDINLEMLDQARDDMGDVAYRRALHVVEENRRPARLASALTANDYPAAGELMNDSHRSLRELYDVSSRHLDIMCETARGHPACYGARLTGAGFGGCAIALVDADATEDFMVVTQSHYEARTYKKSEFFVAIPDAGAHLERARLHQERVQHR